MALLRNVLKITLITQLLCLPLALAAPSSLTFQGRIVKPDGVALEHNNVSFVFQITDPTGACVVYQEQVDGYNMTNSGGVFDVPIGLGSRTWPASGVFTVLDSMNNSASLSCFGGSTFNPAIDDSRRLRVQFYDGVGWKTVSPDNTIRSVPYAGYAASAARLGTNIASDFLLKAGLPTCGAGTFLSWNGTTLSCAAVAGASGGTVTDVTSANGYITIINNTSTPQLTLNVGTSSGTVAAGDDARFTNARTPTGAASGDLSNNYPNPTVSKIQGVDISASAPGSGTFLKFNGTNWQGTAIAISDVASLTTALNAKVNVTQFPSTCAADQALTFSSPSGTFVCASIAITGAQVSGNIAGNAAGFTGALVGDVSGTQGVTSVDKIKGVPVVMTGNGSGKVLTFNGTSWAPADPATSGTVSSVSSSNLYLSVATGTTTPALTVNVGTGANTVAAGNDSRIVNAIQNAGATVSIQSGLDAALPAASLNGKIYIATDTQKIYRDDGTAWVVIASAAGGGGTVTSVASGTGLTGGPITGTGTLAVDVGVTNGKILQLDGSARIPAVDGSLITNLSSGNLAGVVPVNKGGTGLSTYTDGQILIGNSTGGTIAPQTLTGDAAITNAGLVTVNGVKGKSVSAAPSATGQVLRYDGTSWTPNFVSMFDLHSSVTGNAAFGGGGCTSNQTLVWTAATDSLACTNISLPVGQITGTLPIASGGTGASSTSQAFVFAGPASGAGAPAFRALASTDLPSSVLNGLWTESSGNVYRSTGNVGIGTSTPDSSALLQVSSTTQGFLPPKMTTAQRSAIVSPAEGLLVFDTTAGLLYIYRSSSWVKLADLTEVAFHVTKTSTQATTVSTDNVDWGTEVYDVGNAFDLATDRFQPTVAGKYQIIHSTYVSGATADTYATAAIWKNGTEIRSKFEYSPVAGDLQTAVTAVIEMNGTTDYLEFRVRTGAAATLSSSSTYTFAQGFLISGGTGGSGAGADNLGNHVASQNLVLGSNWLTGDGGNEGIRIDTAGNVGIGVSTPTAVAHIASPLMQTSVDGVNQLLQLENTATPATGQLAGIRFRQNDGVSAAQGFIGISNNNTGANGRANFVIAAPNSSGNATARLTITPEGSVGIGTSSPDVALDVNGNIHGNFQGISYYGSSVSAPTGWNDITVPTLDYNTFSGTPYNTTTGVFTAPKTGFYRFNMHGYTAGASASNDRYAMGISKNGTLRAFAGGQYSTSDTPLTTFSHTLRLVAGDTVNLKFYNSLGSTVLLGGGTGHEFWFQCEYVGK